MKAIACAMVAGMAAGPLAAETLTAVCRNPVGWAVGYETGEPKSSTDRFSDSTFTYSWRVGERNATVISQSSKAAGSAPMTEEAIALPLEGSVTFLVTYSRAIWMHTVFLKSKVVMMTRHIDGRGPSVDSAAGSLFHAKCDLSIK